MSAAACPRPACDGHMDEGYCDRCGLAVSRSVAPSPPPAIAARRTAPPGGPVIASRGANSATYSPAVLDRSAQGARRTRNLRPASSRKPLGAGLIDLPGRPHTDPEEAVLPEPSVPERKRFCSRCDAALRRETGFCGRCGMRYSFVPSLGAGDVVADQYEVRGPIAFGGLGWIYLAFDRFLSRYVVLKGLLNAQDTAAAAAAVSERQFLASVKHPNIVAIYNFVEAAGEGFIVMEYIDGCSLKQLRQQRGPLPPAEAVAYIHRILDAFAYLHRQGLVFCDFKPDNVMLESDDVKLIDLGGVRRLNDAQGDIYGTVGYSAPEAGTGPTPASDLFTVGRTLAVLLMEIPGFSTDHRYSLPEAIDKPLLDAQPSLHRLLLKATAANPDDRFSSAEEMGDQLLGVLRELVSTEQGRAHPGSSHAFGTDLLTLEPGDLLDEVGPSPHLLPRPLLDLSDPAGQAVESALLLPGLARRLAALRTIRQQCPTSPEVRLRLAALLIEAGGLSEAEFLLHELTAEDPWNWRATWFAGLLELRRNDPGAACRHFNQITFDLPGELAPKLALGLAAELTGDLATATDLYALVSTVDPSFVSAVFGLARCAQRSGDRLKTVTALGCLPATSTLFFRARVAAIRALLSPRPALPSREDVLMAANLVDTLPLDAADRGLLAEEILRAALEELSRSGRPAEEKVTVLGYPIAERPLRTALEGLLRDRARRASGDERIRLIDAANRVRPRTLF